MISLTDSVIPAAPLHGTPAIPASWAFATEGHSKKNTRLALNIWQKKVECGLDDLSILHFSLSLAFSSGESFICSTFLATDSDRLRSRGNLGNHGIPAIFRGDRRLSIPIWIGA